jgi:hypothetical protein
VPAWAPGGWDTTPEDSSIPASAIAILRLAGLFFALPQHGQFPGSYRGKQLQTREHSSAIVTFDPTRYDELAPMLLNEVQQQAAEIRDLKQQVAGLNNLKLEMRAALVALKSKDRLVARR